MFFRHLKVANKLLILIMMSSLFLIAMGSFGYYFMGVANSGVDNIYNKRLLPVKWINEARTYSRAIEAGTYRIIRASEDKKLQETLTKDTTELIKQFNIRLANYQSTNLDTYELELQDQLKRSTSAYLLERNQAVKIALSGDSQSGFAYLESQAIPPLTDINAILEKLTAYNADKAEKLYQKLNLQNRNTTLWIILITIASLTLSIGVGMLIARFITTPIKELKKMAIKAADGDLSVQSTYYSRDELGELAVAFNRMIIEIGHLIRKVHKTAELVTDSSEQLTSSIDQTTKGSELISNSSQEVASGAQIQAVRMEEGKTTANEITQVASKVVTLTKTVTANALDSSAAARQGSRVMQEASEKMEDINHSVSVLSELVEQMSEQSTEIGGIAEIITEIASRTNILALNASIEAARSGKDGLGFSVIAVEVRKLAEQSIQSAKKVHTLVTNIQEKTQTIVHSMKQASNQVSEGMVMVEKADQSFIKIENSVGYLAEKLQEVSLGVIQMTDGTEQINEMLEDIHKVAQITSLETSDVSAATEEQLASMQEMAATSQHLEQMAQELQTLVERFKV
ncbi:MAG: hypothetical protein JWM44_374 [Bacilli bacterium]|nr:hypothetical protein [Bacilli bacterium]